jgi:GNAT superfamily N-acetyltransferase
LQLKIRTPTLDELPDLSDLCLRSKAVWGYDAAFMEACRAELSLHPQDLQLTKIGVAEQNGQPVGVAQVRIVDDEADLLKLFVEPGALRRGIGRALLAWAANVSTKMGASRLVIDVDPDAAPFYRIMGASDVGEAPSGSIPGRTLPRLMIDLAAD